MGPITSTVAALLRKGVTAIASSMVAPSATMPGRPCTALVIQPASRSVPPVAWMAPLTGIKAASSTSTGQSSAA
jgi:hypothetical protein